MTQQEAPHGIYSIRSKMVMSPNGGGLIFNPYADMHDPCETKIEQLVDRGYQVRGVVHVGANDGKELSWYVTKNYRPILAFEPHPVAFAELKRRYGNHALLWNLALGSEAGILTLFIPEDGDTEKSSKYKSIPTDGHEWTKIPVGSTVNVPVTRFDLWIYQGGMDLSPFNTLVVDVQGMEMEVLEGMGLYIDIFDFLIIECSGTPVYDGEQPAHIVVDWLGQHNFIAITPIEEHDDIIFVNQRVNSNS